MFKTLRRLNVYFKMYIDFIIMNNNYWLKLAESVFTQHCQGLVVSLSNKNKSL